MSNRYINKSISKDRYSNTNNGSTVDFVVSKNLDSLSDNQDGNGIIAPIQFITSSVTDGISATYRTVASNTAGAYSILSSGNNNTLYIGNAGGASNSVVTSGNYLFSSISGTSPANPLTIGKIITVNGSGLITSASTNDYFSNSRASGTVYNSDSSVYSPNTGTMLFDVGPGYLYLFNGSNWIYV